MLANDWHLHDRAGGKPARVRAQAGLLLRRHCWDVGILPVMVGSWVLPGGIASCGAELVHAVTEREPEGHLGGHTAVRHRCHEHEVIARLHVTDCLRLERMEGCSECFDSTTHGKILRRSNHIILSIGPIMGTAPVRAARARAACRRA